MNLFLKDDTDLVITDLQMQVMNGLTLSEKINRRAKDTPVATIIENTIGTEVSHKTTVLKNRLF